MDDTMFFASAMTTRPHAEESLNEVIAQIKEQMAGRSVDFAQIFLTPHFRLTVNTLVERLRKALEPGMLLGCTAESVIGREHEVELEPAIALVAAHMPGLEFAPFTLQSMDWDEMLGQARSFYDTVGASEETRLFVLLCDPFTTPMDRVLQAFNTFYAGLPIIGGLASGSYRPGGNALILNDTVIKNGAVGVAIAGAFEVDVIVSQGCRPIGRPFTVTEARDNIILDLEGSLPVEHLQVLFNELSAADQALLKHGLFIGRAINPEQETLGRGDFLIRGVTGIDRQNGSIIISDYISRGERIQFHVRDAGTAAEDLEMMLTPQMLYEPPAGALLFSCNGRGTRLYDHPDGDISTIHKVVGEINMAGFFCAGEIGPVGGKNFLHGHTASMALFRPSTEEVEPT